jgi:hypothetical protein
MSLGMTACKGNEYQKYSLGDKNGRCVGLTTLPLSYDNYLEIDIFINCNLVVTLWQ